MEATSPRVTPAVAAPSAGTAAPERLLSATHPRSDDVQPVPSRRMLSKQKSVFSSLMREGTEEATAKVRVCYY